MFRITVEGDTLEELAGNLLRIAQLYQTTPAGGDAASKPRRGKAKAEPEQEEPVVETDEQLERELKEEVPPMPDTGKTVVDAGTGKPAGAEQGDGDEPIKMTMDDVKTAAAKLAAKDTPTLAALLKKYGASKLSEVPKDKLGDFAAEVLEAIG